MKLSATTNNGKPTKAGVSGDVAEEILGDRCVGQRPSSSAMTAIAPRGQPKHHTPATKVDPPQTMQSESGKARFTRSPLTSEKGGIVKLETFSTSTFFKGWRSGADPSGCAAGRENSHELKAKDKRKGRGVSWKPRHVVFWMRRPRRVKRDATGRRGSSSPNRVTRAIDIASAYALCCRLAETRNPRGLFTPTLFSVEGRGT